MGGSWKQGTKTSDNFFVFAHFGSVSMSQPFQVKLTSVAGEEITDSVILSTTNDVAVQSSSGGKQFTIQTPNGSATPTRTTTSLPTPPRTTTSSPTLPTPTDVTPSSTPT